jgi:hypothetical protein
MAKVGDAHIDVHADTKKAQDDISKLSKRIEKAGPGLNRFGDYMSYADRAASSLSRRLRSGFTAGYASAVARGENSFIQLGNALEVAGAGFKKIDNESTMALKKFQSLQRRAYSLQSALGAVAGGIGDLAGGFLAVVGVAGQAAYSLVAVGSALTSVVAGFIVTSFATKGVGRALGQLSNSQGNYNRTLRETRRELRDLRFDLEETVLSEQEAAIELEKARTELAMAQDLPPDNMVRREAELAFQRADLNYRKTKARLKDVQDEIKRGGRSAERLAAADPFKDLTKAQIAFTKYLFSIKPLMATLKEAASSSFLPPLTEAIQVLVAKLLPSLQRGFALLGGAMGKAAKSFADLITTPENIKLLDEFFKGSVPTLEAMGRVAGNTFGGILGLLKAAQPLTDRFVNWLERVSKSFEETVKSPDYQKFLTLAGDVAASLGKVIGTFSDGIGNLMRATFAPGGAGYVLIDWLQGIAQGFKDFTGSADFPKWLKDSTTNATVMLSVIGDFLGIFLDLAAAPQTREFFQILSKSIPDLTKIFMDGIKAAPAFAGLIVSITEMFALLSDSGALESFFTTLKVIVDMFNSLLKPLKPILDFIGTIHGFFLAISLSIGILSTGFMIFFALLGRIVKGFGQVFQGVSAVLNAMTRYNQTLAASGTANVKMEQQLARQPGLFQRLRMSVDKHTIAMKSSFNVYRNVPSVMSQYRIMLERLNTRTAANREALKQQGAGFRLLTTNVKIHTNALKLAIQARRADIGILKNYRQSVRTVHDAIRREITATKTSTVAKKQHTGVLKRHMQALKAAVTGTKEANNEEKKTPGPLKLIAASYNSVKTSVNTYRDSLRQLKRTKKEATDATKLEITATKAATAEYVRGAAAAKQYSNSRGFVGLNNARTGMMGMGGGAGTKIFGGAMVAQGLIGSATETGNQTGNILATLGGAAMFSGNPYLMGAGAIASVAGTALNAINAAEEAKKQQKLSILADRVQLDAQVVNQATERANNEILQLLRDRPGLTTVGAASIVSQRSQASNDAVTQTIAQLEKGGGSLTEPEKAAFTDLIGAVRSNLDMSGKVKAEDRNAILKAVARTAIVTPGMDAGQLSDLVLKTLASGNANAVIKKLGATSNLTLETSQLAGDSSPTTRLVDISNTLEKQVSTIIPNLVKQRGNIFNAGVAGTTGIDSLFNTSALQAAGVSLEAVRRYLASDPEIASGIERSLRAFTDNKVISPTNLSGITNDQGRRYEIPNLNRTGSTNTGDLSLQGRLAQAGLISAPQTDAFKAYGVSNFNPNQRLFSGQQFALSNMVLPGKETKVQVVPSPADIAATKVSGTRAERTNTLLEQLAGTRDSTGRYLMIKDASRTDANAPKIVIPDGLRPSERKQYELLNDAIKAAFIAGG